MKRLLHPWPLQMLERKWAAQRLCGASFSILLTAMQDFGTRLWYAAEEDIEAETKPIGGTPLVTQRISDIEVSRRLRWFLANRLIALGWALKGSCKSCARRLFNTARRLVPEAQRFLVHRSHNRNRRILEFSVYLGTLLSRIQPTAAGGFLIVLALVGSLELAMRTKPIDNQPFLENSAFRQEPQISSESKIVSISKSSEPKYGFALETASLSGAQIAPVPLPLRKPERVYKVPNGKEAKTTLGTQKRMAEQKRARPKPMR